MNEVYYRVRYQLKNNAHANIPPPTPPLPPLPPLKPPKNPLYTNDKHDSGGVFRARGELIIALESWFFQQLRKGPLPAGGGGGIQYSAASVSRSPPNPIPPPRDFHV